MQPPSPKFKSTFAFKEGEQVHGDVDPADVMICRPASAARKQVFGLKKGF